ncbi:hypothetical protein SRM_00545 [Salinibacter ruber M8]|uniref:Uncharacterized protein n=1 Tax=Salinibacter ruber (strain M8) TaxID=761659 RepID=D5H611_SALRM|nr:hypothetical protein SRM_00545 [Salinibacter ruber M8]
MAPAAASLIQRPRAAGERARLRSGDWGRNYDAVRDRLRGEGAGHVVGCGSRTTNRLPTCFSASTSIVPFIGFVKRGAGCLPSGGPEHEDYRFFLGSTL